LVCGPGPASSDIELLQAQPPGLFGPLQITWNLRPPLTKREGHTAEQNSLKLSTPIW